MGRDSNTCRRLKYASASLGLIVGLAAWTGTGVPSATAGPPGGAAPATPNIIYILVGDTARQKKHDYLYWEFYERGGKQAVRMGRWKGVRLGLAKNPNAPLELYDLEQDPGEQRDVAATHPEIVKQILATIKEAHAPSEVFSFTGGADASKLPQSSTRK